MQWTVDHPAKDRLAGLVQLSEEELWQLDGWAHQAGSLQAFGADTTLIIIICCILCIQQGIAALTIYTIASWDQPLATDIPPTISLYQHYAHICSGPGTGHAFLDGNHTGLCHEYCWRS